MEAAEWIGVFRVAGLTCCLDRDRRAAFSAPRPLRRIPRNVSFLDPKPALSLCGGNWSSCPTPVIRQRHPERRKRVESGCGAVAVGWACLFPPLSSGGALVAQP